MIKELMRKWFEVPNKPDALPMRPFCNKEDWTWEDWEVKAKKEFPIRYFLSETFPVWYAVHFSMRIDNFVYFIKSHLVPSRRHHILDLRQPKTDSNFDNYRYGHIDAYKKINYALFNILRQFIEVEHKGNYQKYIDLQKSCGLENVDDLEEIKLVYNWLTVEKPKKEKEYSDRLSEWCMLNKSILGIEDETPEMRSKINNVRRLEKELDDDETEMLIRLVKVRHQMWKP